MRIEVPGAGVRPGGGGWYVPVRAPVHPPKRYPYYEKPADIEEHLRANENLDVLLVPAA